MLPPFVSLAELELRLPSGLGSSAEQMRAEAVLEDTSTLIRDEAGKTWVEDDQLVDVPDVIRVITIAAARRAMVNPDGVTQEAVGSYSYSMSNASPDVFLTKNEKQRIRKVAGRLGVWTQATTRAEDDMPDLESVYEDVVYAGDGAGEPIPYYPADFV